MPQIEVLYTPAATTTNPDLTTLLSHLHTIVGGELAAGWRITASAPASPESWIVTLEHDTVESSVPIREQLLTANDPILQLHLGAAYPGAETAPPAKPEAAPSAKPAPTPVIDALSLPLPVEVPAVLLGSEAAQRRRAAIQGITTGLVVSAVMGLLTPQGNVIRHMFDPRNPTAAVPTGILCLFFWGITYGLNRRRRLEAIESLNADDLLPAVVSGLRFHGVERLEQALRGQTDQYSVVRYSPLLRRIWVTLEQWMIRPSLQNAHLVIEQQVISDREATQRAYNLLRIFVWATPVLGLIGTVVGISIAVGGFAGFLSTSVDDISKIKAGLVGVTGGLSFAFLITLEGLLSSLILMLFTSSIQTREERLYAEIERDVAERFLPDLQRISPERELSAAFAGADAWTEAMSEAARKVIRAVEIAGKRILAKWDEKHEVYVSDLTGVGETVNSSALKVATALSDAAAALQNLGELSTRALESQTVLNDSRLPDVLSDLNTSLKDLKPLLSSISQPFVLQAIPAPPRNRE